MNQDFENPFVDCGSIVRGERFIGRKENLKVIKNRIIRPREPGNLAIIGEPRIGKSSLVYKAIMERKDELVKKKLLPVWINLATYDKAPLFFQSLVIRCLDKMKGLDWVSKPIQDAADSSLQDNLSWSEEYGRIQDFFETVKQSGVHVLFILDEFDNARRLFHGDIPGFQGLRELAYHPEWKVTYIVASRRTIRDIELQTQAISTFDGIFQKHYLSMFVEEDLEEYFSRLSSIGVSLNSEAKKHVIFYCGGHPYLLEMLGYEILEVFRDKQKTDVEMAAQRIIQDFISQYERMIDLLREDGNLGKLLQILFGPIVDVKQTDVEELLRYGFIKAGEKDTYVAFSEHFQIFLNLTEREVDMDLWPLWSQTEKALRHIVSTMMLKQYGENWIKKLEKARPNLKKIFQRCRQAQEKEEKSFSSRASHNLVDFTYPHDLFVIIFAEWSIFKATFGKDKTYWAQRSDLLAKIRNPLAHNRDKALYDYERLISEGYLKEILRVINLKK